MDLKIYSTNALGTPAYYYLTSGDDFSNINTVTINGNFVDLDSLEEVAEVIDILKQCKITASESEDFSKFASTMFGAYLGFGKVYADLVAKANATTDTIIQALTAILEELENDPEIEEYNDYSECEELCEDQEAIAGYLNNACNLRKSRTFELAQRYMNEVFDADDQMDAAEYNTLLAMFTQYGDWILAQ